MLTTFSISRSSAVRKIKKGLTLMEAAMVLAIMAVVISGVMWFYVQTSNTRKAEATTTFLLNLIQGVNQIYATAPDYTGLSLNDIRDLSFIPAPYRGKTDSPLLTPLGGYARVFLQLPKTGANTYDMQIAPVSKEQCINIAKLDFGSQVVDLKVGTSGTPGAVPTGYEDASSDTSVLDNNTVSISKVLSSCDAGARITYTLSK